MTADDIYTEPEGDPDTLASLGPLAGLAGTWSGTGVDQHPQDPMEGPVGEDSYDEHYDAQPIDFQTNGPQLLYGLHYRTRIVKTGEIAMFHDQTGYWLWEPATNTVMLTVAIPRGQVALCVGQCDPNARAFEVRAERTSLTNGICTAPFLDANFTTLDFRMTVRIHDDGTWSYDQNTRLQLPDRAEPFDHTDANTLHRIAPPTPNPLARAAVTTTGADAPGLGIGDLRT